MFNNVLVVIDNFWCMVRHVYCVYSLSSNPFFQAMLGTRKGTAVLVREREKAAVLLIITTLGLKERQSKLPLAKKGNLR